MPTLFEDSAQCCGCSACYAICPVNAITMQSNEEGFLYPDINSKKCIECKSCEKVCPFNITSEKPSISNYPQFIAVKHKEKEVKLSSSSGGAFTAISDHWLENGGIIYGVIFDDSLKAIHTRAENKQMRDKMRVSKYVQSDVEDIFRQVKSDLLAGLNVLFTGTPCQVAGLRNFLKKDYANLITCDVICHGVPSPLMFNEHIKHIEKVRKNHITNYTCRSKVSGWHTHTECANFANRKSEYGTPLIQEHKVLFYSGYILRPSCYECKFTNLNRPSDLTLGDFWGIEKIMPEWDDQIGTSMVIVNTVKGAETLFQIKDVANLRESKTYGRQPQLEKPAHKPKNRVEFWQDYKSKGYPYIASKYGRNSPKEWLKFLIKKILKY